jgi:hypothetical protein
MENMDESEKRMLLEFYEGIAEIEDSKERINEMLEAMDEGFNMPVKVIAQEIKAVLAETGKVVSQIFFCENNQQAIKRFKKLAVLCNVFYKELSVREVDIYV